MRILIFNYEYPPLGGGGGVVNEAIAEELARRHDVVVVTTGFRDLQKSEIRNGVSIVRVPVWGRRDREVATLRSMLTYPPSAWVNVLARLRSQSFDIVNSHFAVPTGPGSLPIARLADLPHVLSIHGGDIFNPSNRFAPHKLPIVRNVVNLVLRGSDAVVAQSRDTRANAYRYYRYRGPIDVVPLGIRRPSVPSTTRARLGLPEGVFLATTVGRLIPRKSIDRLLRALATERCREVHLAVMGEGPEREPLTALASELGVEDRVQFLGWVSEELKWQVLESSDAYVSSTRHEGFGLVFLEAMSAGLPVICPDHGGHLDFLLDGETGYLVALDDEGALADAIARLERTPEMAVRMGERCRRISDYYTIERCASAYEALFDRVVAGHRRRGIGRGRPVHEPYRRRDSITPEDPEAS